MLLYPIKIQTKGVNNPSITRPEKSRTIESTNNAVNKEIIMIKPKILLVLSFEVETMVVRMLKKIKPITG